MSRSILSASPVSMSSLSVQSPKSHPTARISSRCSTFNAHSLHKYLLNNSCLGNEYDTTTQQHPIALPAPLLLNCSPMGLLDHLWDDTVAGPPPDTGLGKLRKHATFSFRSNSGKESEAVSSRRSFGEEAAEDAARVTRSIMIVKPPLVSQKDSPPVSPAGSTPPVSPFSGGGGREAFRFRRKSASFAYEKGSVGGRSRSPPPPHDV